MKLLFLVFIFAFTLNNSWALNPIAEVIKVRGEVTQLSPGSKSARLVSLGDKLEEDTSILTGAKSFLKIKFIDNSEMNIGPDSKIVITAMKANEPGLISLLKGKIRTQVEKSTTSNNNKFFIKTRTAAMGIRGTDFQTIYNPDNKITSLLTYNGEVAMAKLSDRQYRHLEENEIKNEIIRNNETKDIEVKKIETNEVNETSELNKILSTKETVLVPAGQNSFVSQAHKKTTLPVKISPIQLNALYKNSEFKESDVNKVNSVDLKNVENEKFVIKSADQKAPLEGYKNEKNGDFAPRAGGLIDLETGLYIAPDSDSKLDKKQGVYVSEKVGSIDKDTGHYLAPKGLKLDAKNGFIVEGASNEPKLYTLKDDLNKSIAQDVVAISKSEIVKAPFLISEKFVRDELSISTSFTRQSIQLNENINNNGNNHQYLEAKDKPFLLSIEWKMASVSRFRPLVGGSFANEDYKQDALNENISSTSAKLYNLYFGGMYAFNENIDLIAKFGTYQSHFLDQSPTTNNFSIYKIVLNRLTLGIQSIWLSESVLPISFDLEGYITQTKRLNDLKVKSGLGHYFFIAANHSFSDRHMIKLGLFSNTEKHIIQDSVGENHFKNSDGGPKLQYLYKF